MSEFRAYVADSMDGFAFDHARLIIRDDRTPGHRYYLMGDGSWLEMEASSIRDDFGVLLPKEAFEAIARAIQEWQGHASHADTEARVLREWLAVERARVDRLMDNARDG